MNRSGTHRTLGFVRHLDAIGWDATVLTAEPSDDPLDQGLVADIPTSTRVLRVPWIDLIEQTKIALGMQPPQTESPMEIPAVRGPDRCEESTNPPHRTLREWVSRLLITPDSRTGWIAPAVRAGIEEVTRNRPAVIYSSAPCMSAHLIALLISRWTRLPWIADFRDPWVNNPYRDVGFNSLQWWDAWLERRVLRHASHVICATPTMTQQLCVRHPFVRSKCSTILNGFDRHRMVHVRPQRTAPATEFVLTHAGQFYGPRSPHVWFAAIQRIAKRSPDRAARIRFQLLGSETFEGKSLRQWAEDYGIERYVSVLGTMPHAKTLNHLAGSDAVALATGGGEGADLQVPNKLFEYLALRRPIVATCVCTSPVVQILEAARADAVICAPDDVESLAQAIERLSVQRRVGQPAPWQNVERFDRCHRAHELADIFTRVTGMESTPIPTTRPEVSITNLSRPRTDVIPIEDLRFANADAWSTTTPHTFARSNSRPCSPPTTSPQSCPSQSDACDEEPVAL